MGSRRLYRWAFLAAAVGLVAAKDVPDVAPPESWGSFVILPWQYKTDAVRDRALYESVNLRGLHVDTVCYSRAALECCHATLGASRMIYGTDHPFGEPSQAAELIDSLDCSPDERELIYHGNLEALTQAADATKSAALERA